MYSCALTQLGVLINARKVALSMLENKCNELTNIVLTLWSISRERCTLREIAFLFGLVSKLSLAAQLV